MATTDISTENYSFLQQHVYRESGIVLDNSKQYLLEARLSPIARREGVGNVDGLCNLMRAVSREDLRREVVEAMTTNETLFFRDLSPFDALRSHILPALKKRREATRTISVWSAAASSGQEAYSIVMYLLEAGFGEWNIRVLGTDLSEQVLARARQGRYMQVEVGRGLPAPLLVKYFDRVGLEWQIKEEVRKLVRFEQFDLRRSMTGKGPFDLIFCRNVLIYFDVETKDRIMSSIYRVLAPDGYLTLGAAESMLQMNTQFERYPVGKAIYYTKPGVR
ncbi:chemotaxis protein methyltransferase [Bryobacterales bacterium F-183]|nr:chemotaxis protein methyltransferase [Bryobacterales bacterium F-183]